VTIGDVRASYDAVAQAYADRYADELDHKPLDRALLAAFVEQLPGEAPTVCDAGCGPGHVSAHLATMGTGVIGIDVSPGMVSLARSRYPNLRFQTTDMSAMPAADGEWSGIVAMYSIVHLSPTGLPAVFGEFVRVLAPSGLLLLAFHTGDQVLHVEEFLGESVALDFHLLGVDIVGDALRDAGFDLRMTMTRRAYEPFEVDTVRGYILARRR
jgi:SAM-dependent methyltransferase